jgi:hypothetical protein
VHYGVPQKLKIVLEVGSTISTPLQSGHLGWHAHAKMLRPCHPTIVQTIIAKGHIWHHQLPRPPMTH